MVLCDEDRESLVGVGSDSPAGPVRTGLPGRVLFPLKKQQ